MIVVHSRAENESRRAENWQVSTRNEGASPLGTKGLYSPVGAPVHIDIDATVKNAADRKP